MCNKYHPEIFFCTAQSKKFDCTITFHAAQNVSHYTLKKNSAIVHYYVKHLQILVKIFIIIILKLITYKVSIANI